ncbi:hypothetical protein U3450_003946 [Bacillus cytotoxicus]|uniref:XkdQ/YqbQ family protein n=1 Tax=unclassified Bacillus cereus group TaxID=2750818 RepID=UPI001F59301B|nr:MULTISPECIES: hypothetical protein [unclassified Bacillus cereus group]EMA6344888.1 hypothetical protein [Bacillus cytotoxicus]
MLEVIIGNMVVTDAVVPPIKLDDDYQNGPVKVELTLIYKPEFDEIDGKPLKIIVNGNVWFVGVVRGYKNPKGRNVDVTAYDHLFNLVKSDDEFLFQNRTASQMIRSILNRYSYPIKELVEINTIFPLMYLDKNNAQSVFEMLIIILYESKKRTGKKYWIRFEPEGLRIFEWKPARFIPVLGSGLTNSEKTVSVEEVKNKITVVNREKNIIAVKSDGNSIKKYGPLSTVEEFSGDTEAAAISYAESILGTRTLPDVSRQIEHVHSIEEPRIWSGDYIYLEDPTKTILGGYYVKKAAYQIYRNYVVFSADVAHTAALPSKEYVPPQENNEG